MAAAATPLVANRAPDPSLKALDGKTQKLSALRAQVVVVNFWAFTREHAVSDIETFTGRVGQYVFISSASAYAKPVPRLPIHESTPLANPYWGVLPEQDRRRGVGGREEIQARRFLRT